MCGIAGIVGRDARRSQEVLERMRVSLAHRGPDDTGTWRAAPSTDVSFAHTRLAVIDPSAGGHQPMSTPDGRLTISYNGEIYNFRALRAELERRGARFHTRADTEVILHAYAAFGVECLTLLRGMFAFAIWDEQERRCFLARDPFGVKPLYFHHGADGALVFASEVRAIQASGLVRSDLSPQGLYGYLRTGSVPEPATLLKDVAALEAGHYLEWREGTVRTHCYWAPRFSPDASGNHHREVTREALLDSMRHHFVSDVPVSVLLSGGVDSAAMLALASAAGHQGVRTFSMTFPGSAANEGPVARKTAEHFSSTHSECAVDAATARALFPEFLAAADQPSIDGFNTFVVARSIRDHGLKVALSGVGADELFGGYASFARVPQIAAWNQQLTRTGPVRTVGGWLIERLSPGPRWRRVGDLLQQPASLANTHAMFRGIYTRHEARTLTEAYGVAPPDEEGAGSGPVSATDEDEVSRLELTRYVRNQLLRDSDVTSMACGVELRTPFLDVTLFEAIADIPSAVRLGRAKQLLREAVPELPPWVFGAKRCFQFPFDEWLAGEWRPVFAEVEARSPVPTETWYRKWSVLALENWLARMTTHVR